MGARRVRRVGPVGAVLTGMALAARFLGQPAPASAGGPLPGTVAIVPFTNLTGSAVADWMGLGIAEALAAGFPAGTAVVARRDGTVAADEAAAAPVSAEDAAGVGRALDVPFVLVGAYHRFGSRLRITPPGSCR